MATYKTADLINRLSELINDGYEYVDVTEAEADEDMPEALLFEAIESESCSVSYEDVESVDLPDNYDCENNYRNVADSDFCLTLPFTYEELNYLSSAVDNALKLVKERIRDSSCSKEEIVDMKAFAVHWRNLQAKFAKFRKSFRKA